MEAQLFVFEWDRKDQPDWKLIGAAVAQFDKPAIVEAWNRCLEFTVVVGERPLTEKKAQQLVDAMLKALGYEYPRNYTAVTALQHGRWVQPILENGCWVEVGREHQIA